MNVSRFAVVIAFALLLPLPAAAQSKIGFVNTQRVLSQSSPAIRAQKRLEAEFLKRGQELERMADQLKRMQEELDRNAMTWAETHRRTKEREFGEVNREFQRKQRELREDMNQRKNEELRLVIDQADRVIRQIAEQEKFDIIFQDAAFVAPRVDITDKVIKALEDKSAK
jgi:outer membrane protein